MYPLLLWVLSWVIFLRLGKADPEEIFQKNFKAKLKHSPYSVVKFDGIQDSDSKANSSFIQLYHQVLEVEGLSLYHVRFSGLLNVKLRKKLNMEAGRLPEIILYDINATEISRFGSSIKLRDLIDWIGSKTGLYMNRPGCSKDLDTLSQGFLRFPQKRQNFLEAIRGSPDEYRKHRYEELIKDFIKSSDQNDLKNFINERLKNLRGLLKAERDLNKKNDIRKKINVAKAFSQQPHLNRLPRKAKLKTEL